jgi:hypothetical protein
MAPKTKLAREISQALEENELTAAAGISVVDDEGVITLKGVVETYEISEAAESIAESFDEVEEVVNDLSVEEDYEEDDEDLIEMDDEYLGEEPYEDEDFYEDDEEDELYDDPDY